jgi:hypothetical protein
VMDDVRRIHIDRSPKSAEMHLPESSRTEIPEGDVAQVRHFQDAITRIVRQGDTMSESSRFRE